MTTGFVVGKFYPPHKGHKHLIDAARRQVDRLIVLVPHHPSQRIPGELRRDWLREIHADCEIHLVPDELENDSAQWAEFTINYLGRAPDVVFSSEDYGPIFAGLMGCRHVMVDRPRSTFPTSGTAIRQSPLDHLDMLEPCVRAYFVKRVVLIGAESTGKTTLARALSEHFNTNWVPEYGREYWERKVAGLDMKGPLPAFTSEEFVTIASEQQRRENELARTANKVLICDTNAFATGTWHERYLGFRSPAVDAIGAADKVDLYLLTEPDFPFVQDGFRDGEHIREQMHRGFISQLSSSPARFIRIDGPPDQRIKTAVLAIEAIMRTPLEL